MSVADIRPDPQRAARLRRLESRALTRRGLLTGGMAAGMLALSGPLAQAGDLSSLRVAVPHVRWDHPPAWLVRLLHRTLTTLAPDGTLRPGAAVAWDGGGAAWQVWLRDPLVVESVVGEMVERRLRPTALSANGLAVRLPEADDGWPFRLATDAWAIAPGPYALERPDCLVARDPAMPVRRVELTFIDDPYARLAALQAGDVEAATDIPPNALVRRSDLVPVGPDSAATTSAAAALSLLLQIG